MTKQVKQGGGGGGERERERERERETDVVKEENGGRNMQASPPSHRYLGR